MIENQPLIEKYGEKIWQKVLHHFSQTKDQ